MSTFRFLSIFPLTFAFHFYILGLPIFERGWIKKSFNVVWDLSQLGWTFSCGNPRWSITIKRIKHWFLDRGLINTEHVLWSVIIVIYIKSIHFLKSVGTIFILNIPYLTQLIKVWIVFYKYTIINRFSSFRTNDNLSGKYQNEKNNQLVIFRKNLIDSSWNIRTLNIADFLKV